MGRPLLLVGLLVLCGRARADDVAGAPGQKPVPAQVAEAASPAVAPAPVEPSTPLGWWWKNTTPVPILFYSPENQLGFGAGAMTTWRMPGAYPDRPSNVLVYGIYTTRRQTIVGASYELRFHDDRHVWTQTFNYIDWPDRYYGIGNDTRVEDRDNYTDHYNQLESEYQVRAISHLYVGARHLLRASQTRDVGSAGTLADTQPFGLGQKLWSGAGPLLVWDSRKGLFWPTRGSLLRADATFHGRALGADFRATLYRIDLRHYQPLPWASHVLAIRLVGMQATGRAPYQFLPALGGSTLFRGWFLGRLRDRALLATEVEYRMPFTTWFSGVLFGSLGRVAERPSELSPRGLRAAGGGGVRVAVRKETRANFRLDLAYGDELYVYFQFREAF